MTMKREYTYDFLVEHTIYDVSKQVGKSKDDIEELSSSELRDLYVNGSGDLDCGDIEVDDEYYREPEYYEEDDELFAQFCAHFTITVEGKNEEECDEKVEKAFEMSDFGDYEFVVGCICERDSREITPEKDNIERD